MLGGCDDERAPVLGTRFDAGRDARSGTHPEDAVGCDPEAPRCVSCPFFGTAELTLSWPLDGLRGRDWAISNYLDLDPVVGALEDHRGATGELARTYDSHRGLDVVIPNFRAMDEGVPVRAVAEGRVEHVVDGHDDRETEFQPRSCTKTGNSVQIRHPSGYVHFYTHFRKGSIRVAEGELVTAGDVLGEVGSSGCSSWPHLHLEVRDCQGASFETFLSAFWLEAPTYEADVGIMDVVVRPGGFGEAARLEILDPAPNPSSLRVGETVGLAVLVGEGRAGDAIEIEVVGSDGEGGLRLATELPEGFRRGYYYWNRSVNLPPGPASIAIRANGTPLRTVQLEVTTE